MKCVVALDLSEKPGFAVFQDGKLIRSGTLFNEWKKSEMGPYPFNYLEAAYRVVEAIRDKILLEVMSSHPEKIDVVCEETTASQNNYSQKSIEFIHFRLAEYVYRIKGIEIHYVRTGIWRGKVGAVQTKEERNYNAKISRQKKKKKEAFLKENPGADKVPSFRAKLDVDGSGKAKVVRRLDEKDYALRVVKERFGLELDYEQNDEADAICLGLAFIEGCPTCDGTVTGGLNSKKEEADGTT
jgi:hypothetical protein